VNRIRYAWFRFRGFDRKLRWWLDELWDAKPFTRFEPPPTYMEWRRHVEDLAALTATIRTQNGQTMAEEQRPKQ